MSRSAHRDAVVLDKWAHVARAAKIEQQ